MLLDLLTACAPPALGWRDPAPDVAAAADTVDFGAVALGATGSATLALHNAGDAAVDLAVHADAPFGAARETITVGAGADASLELWFRPTGYAEAAGTVRLGGGDTLVVVALAGAADPDGDGDGHAAVDAGGDDCDDADAAVRPGAQDDCYDGVDADCDRADDDDCDGDGWPVSRDCDDGDPAVSPGAAEAGPDGRDDDCDGLVDESLLAAGDVFVSELHPGGSAWVELCSAADRDLRLDGFRLSTRAGDHALDAATLPAGGCVTVCASAADGCPLTAPGLALDSAADLVHVDAGALVLDAVAPAGWAYAAGATWSLDAGRGAADNDAAGAWCLTEGSAGSPNPACP